MARFDDFTFDELLEVHTAAVGFESWYDEMYAALERRAGSDGVVWPPPAPSVSPTSGVDVNALLARMVSRKPMLEVTFDSIPIYTHNWGL